MGYAWTWRPERAVLPGTRELLDATTGLHSLLTQINRGDGALSRMINDPEMYQRMVSAAARVDSLAALALNGNGSLAQLMRSDSLYRGLVGLTTRGDAAAAELASLLQKVNRPDGTFNRLLTDPRLFDELERDAAGTGEHEERPSPVRHRRALRWVQVIEHDHSSGETTATSTRSCGAPKSRREMSSLPSKKCKTRCASSPPKPITTASRPGMATAATASPAYGS